MFRLAHISDIHLGPLPDVTYRELASKRMIGYVNWQRNRKSLLQDGVLDAIVSDIRHTGVDHLAITGDLVNLALDGEVALAEKWLETLGPPEDVSVVPGNHDAYVPGAFARISKAWAPWMRSDGFQGPVSRETFPYTRIRGNVALIGVTSARATAPFMATGFFRPQQAARLQQALRLTGEQGLFRVVMIHHPPVRDAVHPHKRLFGITRFQKVIRRCGAELVLHGHSHLPSHHTIPGKDGPVPVIGVAAAGQAPGSHHPVAQWNLFEISGGPGDWSATLTRRSFTGTATGTSQGATTDLRELEHA
ncbi:MAG: metallophosphoesterase [Rhizobiales bacterium]|nr:metallophosphoesterase [Hyphomicrobiales bacterium]